MRWLGIDRGEGDRLRAESAERLAESYREEASKRPRTDVRVQVDLEAAAKADKLAEQYRNRAGR